MDTAALDTITDIDALRVLVREQQGVITAQQSAIAERDRTLVYRQAKIDTLTAEIARLKRWQFGRRAESMDPAQRALFEDVVAADIAAIETELTALRDPASPAPRHPKRQALPAHLPRVEQRHEPASCTCADCGNALVSIGEDVTEQLDCEPVRFFVRKHIYPKYTCRQCDTVVAAPSVPAVIDRGLPAPGLLAHILVGKYADHLPLYRQQQMIARSGIELASSTLSGWVGASGVALMPLVAAMKAELLAEHVLHADETPVAMLDPGAGKTQRAYLFAYRTASPQTAPIVIFDFCTSRSGEHARHFLGDYRGALMVDDYAGYKASFANGVTELGCWAHARRLFFELQQANASSHADAALAHIAMLYRIEAEARELDPPLRHAYRLEHATPGLHTLHQWMIDLRPRVANGSGLARALDYTLRRWAALARYLDDGHYPIDNNALENAIRPIALGRKNWLFAGSESAGKRAAAIMSLIGTAKHNGHDPYAYLKDVLTRLPTHPDRRIAELLPHRWQPAA